jgi:hypothetical protein
LPVPLRPSLLAGLAAALALSAGCASLAYHYPEHPPVGVPCKLALQMKPELVETQDSVNGGAQLRGLAGRVFLIQDLATAHPITCDGELIVDLYDDRPTTAGGQPVRLERWVFSDPILKQLIRKDATGWGYTLFLPWVKTYRPDITLVHLQAAFTPKGSVVPLFENSPSIALAQGNFSAPPGVAQGAAPKTPPAAPAANPAVIPTAAQQPAPMPPAAGLPPQQPAPGNPSVPGRAATEGAVQPPAPLPVAVVSIPVQGRPLPAAQPPALPAPPPPAPLPVPVSQVPEQANWTGMAKQ